MSYQVLARKWRPQTFSDVVGQEHVLTALANGLSLGRIHHAYLFSGTRGVGKTSIARLLAKGLNCETGITSTRAAYAITAVKSSKDVLSTCWKSMRRRVLKLKIRATCWTTYSTHRRVVASKSILLTKCTCSPATASMRC